MLPLAKPRSISRRTPCPSASTNPAATISAAVAPTLRQTYGRM